MHRPPSRSLLAGVGVLGLVFALFAGATVLAHAGGQPASPTLAACTDDSYSPPVLDREWDEPFVDGLANGSLADWTGGRLVAVGASGDCSLAVLDGERARLDAATVNGSHGVVTGTLDLGESGRLRLAPIVGNGSGPAENGSALAVSNPGPDFATTVALTVGNESTRVSLANGRFFEFAIQQFDGTTRIAVWEAGTTWDEQWDLQVENRTAGTDWRVRLDGRAFLDGIAVGVVDESETAPTTDTETTAATDDDDFEDDRFDQPRSDEPDSGDGRIVGGLFLLLAGSVTAYFARGLTTFSEEMDAIGSKRRGPIEPAEWNVALTRLVGIVLIGVGLYLLGAALL